MSKGTSREHQEVVGEACLLSCSADLVLRKQTTYLSFCFLKKYLEFFIGSQQTDLSCVYNWWPWSPRGMWMINGRAVAICWVILDTNEAHCQSEVTVEVSKRGTISLSNALETSSVFWVVNASIYPVKLPTNIRIHLSLFSGSMLPVFTWMHSSLLHRNQQRKWVHMTTRVIL